MHNPDGNFCASTSVVPVLFSSHHKVAPGLATEDQQSGSEGATFGQHARVWQGLDGGRAGFFNHLLGPLRPPGAAQCQHVQQIPAKAFGQPGAGQGFPGHGTELPTGDPVIRKIARHQSLCASLSWLSSRVTTMLAQAAFTAEPAFGSVLEAVQISAEAAGLFR